MKVLFSIVIANYNYGRFLEDAIVSVLNQCCPARKCPDGVSRLSLPTGEFVELIVCDGGSVDDSVTVIKRYADSISWWCSEKDLGQSDAFNKGFAHSIGLFLTWLNADDIFTRGALLKIRNVWMSNPSCRWITGSSLYTDRNLINVFVRIRSQISGQDMVFCLFGRHLRFSRGICLRKQGA